MGTSCDFGVPYVNFGILQIFTLRYPAKIYPGPPSDFTVSDTGTCYPAHEKNPADKENGHDFYRYGTLCKAAGLKLINVKIAAPPSKK